MYPDREHIDIGRHAGRADRFCLRQVRFGGLERLLRRLEAFSRQDRTVICSDHTGNHLHLGSALLFSGHLPREIGRFHCVASLPGVVQDLVHRQL